MRKIVFIFSSFVICASASLVFAMGEKEKKQDSHKTSSLTFMIVDLDGDGFETIPLSESSVYFDVDGDGWAERTEWIKPDDGFLSLSEPMKYMEVDESGGGAYSLLMYFMTSGLDDFQNLDTNNDLVFNQEDYLIIGGRAVNKLSATIYKDRDLNGLVESKRDFITSCERVTFSVDENMSEGALECGESAYPVLVKSFEYENTNSRWEALCESIPLNDKYIKEYCN